VSHNVNTSQRFVAQVSLTQTSISELLSEGLLGRRSFVHLKRCLGVVWCVFVSVCVWVGGA